MRYKILKDFKGSQDGMIVEEFLKGSEADLSEYLVACVDPAWIEAISAPEAKAADGGEIDNKATSTDGQQGGKVRNKAAK